MSTPNIGPKQRSLRRVVGATAAVASAVGIVPILSIPLAPAWTWLLVFPIFVAVLSAQQAKAGC